MREAASEARRHYTAEAVTLNIILVPSHYFVQSNAFMREVASEARRHYTAEAVTLNLSGKQHG